MPLDISFHPFGEPFRGNHPPAPALPVIAKQKSLAEAVPSQAFVAPGGVTGSVCVLVLTATIKLRVDIQKTGDALDPANSGIVLLPDVPRTFSVREGSWTVQSAVYAA